MSLKNCGDQRRNNKGVVVVTCSLTPHTDPEHVDMHAGRHWYNVPREQVEPLRTMLALAAENSALGLVDKPSAN